MDPEAIIAEHYRPGSRLWDLVLSHGRRVRDKALAAAAQVPHLQPDTALIAEAALLHDIGVYWTHAPAIHCHGAHPYVCHGIIGRHLLLQYGLQAHGLVCERHVGAGLTRADIAAQRLPLPLREMVPVTLEEIIVCYADNFFSKTNGGREHDPDAVLAQLGRYGAGPVQRFMRWHRQFTAGAQGEQEEGMPP